MEYTIEDLKRDIKKLNKKVKMLEKELEHPEFLSYLNESDVVAKLIAPVYFAKYMQLIGKYFGLEKIRTPYKVTMGGEKNHNKE